MSIKTIRAADPIELRNEALKPFGYSVERKRYVDLYRHQDGFKAFYDKRDVTIAELDQHRSEWRAGMSVVKI